jgi:hypothetical protein
MIRRSSSNAAGLYEVRGQVSARPILSFGIV